MCITRGDLARRPVEAGLLRLENRGKAGKESAEGIVGEATSRRPEGKVRRKRRRVDETKRRRKEG